MTASNVEVGELVDAHGAGRRRITVHARRGGDGELRVGFAEANSHAIVPIGDCPILDPGLHGALDAARALAEVLKPTSKPLDIQVTAVSNGLDVDVRGSGPLPSALIATLSRVAEQHRLARLTRHGELVLMRDAAVHRDRLRTGDLAAGLVPASDIRRRGSAGGAGDGALQARQTHRRSFCGVGPFALRLAAKSRVSAFDSDAGAVTALQKAATSTSGLKPLKAESRDLFRRPLVPQELRDYDTVVFDPPRQGRAGTGPAARRQQNSCGDRGLLQRRNLCTRRQDADRWRLQNRGRDSSGPVSLYAACRTGGAVQQVRDLILRSRASLCAVSKDGRKLMVRDGAPDSASALPGVRLLTVRKPAHRPHLSCQIFSPIMQDTRGSCSATGTIGRSGVLPATSRTSLLRIASLNFSRSLIDTHERAGTADHAILVVPIEIFDIHRRIGRLLHHDRQTVDGDALGQRGVARDGDRRAVVVGAVAGNIDDAAQPAIRVLVEQRHRKIDRA